MDKSTEDHLTISNLKDQFYIYASSFSEDTRVLKEGDTFLVTDVRGAIRPLGFESHGLFHEGTRFLSKLVLKFENVTPLLLSSRITEQNSLLVIDLANPDCILPGGYALPKDIVHISRSILLWEKCYYEHIKLTNFGLIPLEFSLSLEFDSDFKDIFEVRGMKREKSGNMLEPRLESKNIILSYKGLDDIVRKAIFMFFQTPSKITPKLARFSESLLPKETKDFYYALSCEIEPKPVHVKTYERALHERTHSHRSEHLQNECVIESSNTQFNEWINISSTDLTMMLTKTPEGFYPYAGVPWYNTVFGRDGLITAMETLWINPDIARGVLSYLAARQGCEVVPEQDCEPGKILHEERSGEMANLKEIPFACYYGTVDATPLFIVLAGQYYNRTADKNFIASLWPHIEKALEWIDTYGDEDKDLFVEYQRKPKQGLTNQGWKDSSDSVFHSDGTLAQAPIALCEVQGYVYEAKQEAAKLAALLGHNNISVKLAKAAEELKEKFHKEFWCEDIGTYALALDGEKNKCKVLSSNAGHCLFSGIASPKHAARIAKNFMAKQFFASWGIRTIASSQSQYNPMSYHNGSIWPHDNAIIAAGLNRYGFKKEVIQVVSGLFDASIFMRFHRLPELICGFTKNSEGGSPTLYPVACNPQAWASGSLFLLLQALLGIDIHAPAKRIHFNNPTLPPFIDRLSIKNLHVGDAFVDLVFHRHEQSVAVNITRKKGDVEIIVKE